MELPNDILSCHRLIIELSRFIAGIKPQLEDYLQVIEKQSLQIEQLVSQNKQLETRITELESQIKQNSHNSSQPPSSDKYRIKPAFSRPKGGKLGGKSGHKGGTLKMVEDADYIIPHFVEVCQYCGKNHQQESLEIRGRRQVFDIPAPRIEVTEHQAQDWVCAGCGGQNAGIFPEEVKTSVQYGPRIKSAGVLLNQYLAVPRNKVLDIFRMFYGIEMNESALQNHQEQAYEKLSKDEQYIKGQVQKSPVVHFDETGAYVNGKRIWEHVASNQTYTLLFIHEKRGAQAHQCETSILPDFRGWAVHDCWASYFMFDQAKHAICGSHLLRELNALTENGSKWAKICHKMLLDLYERSDKGRSGIRKKYRKSVKADFSKLFKAAHKEEPPPVINPRGKPKKSKGRNLLERLEKHLDAVLAFAFNKEVPFTNNQAERDIRPTKTKMKVAGCFRTLEGARIYARVQSFCSTVRKLHFNPFNELYTVFNGGIPKYRLQSA